MKTVFDSNGSGKPPVIPPGLSAPDFGKAKWAWLKEVLAANVSLPANALATVIALYLNRKEGHAFPGEALLALNMGISERHVRNLLTELIDAGLLAVTVVRGRKAGEQYKEGKYEHNEYRIIVHGTAPKIEKIRRRPSGGLNGGHRNHSSSVNGEGLRNHSSGVNTGHTVPESGVGHRKNGVRDTGTAASNDSGTAVPPNMYDTEHDDIEHDPLVSKKILVGAFASAQAPPGGLDFQDSCPTDAGRKKQVPGPRGSQESSGVQNHLGSQKESSAPDRPRPVRIDGTVVRAYVHVLPDRAWRKQG